ncbi:hypothetical protein DES39_1591 [Orbus hercynius]|uniref:DUF305 domain-containing protein n=1 Tax=Orbus hercynius TaxID=593135 RepID=A0A495RCS4_9GAMM|nr:DUF305 domain-containing protein [Orbus hercynius]RKS85086.1 hypothetical protein DES39_1591 [Orbus hercynius]
MKKLLVTILTTTLFMSANGAFANMDDHANHGNTNPMTQEYMKAMDDMHKPMMDGVMSSDPDVAFVAGMIPHHQGAIDMANIELKYGKDPEIKALAEQVIKAQEQEIAFMKKWLEQHQTK